MIYYELELSIQHTQRTILQAQSICGKFSYLSLLVFPFFIEGVHTHSYEYSGIVPQQGALPCKPKILAGYTPA